MAKIEVHGRWINDEKIKLCEKNKAQQKAELYFN